jgi:hypothetical protein
VSTADPDPTAAPARPPYVIPPQDLRDMVLTLPRPPADAPETAWQEVVQAGLNRLEALDPRDALQTMLAVTVIATQAGAVDACRLAFAPDASAVQALRQRASAAALLRVMAGALRSLKQLRLQPAAPARDWGDAARDEGGGGGRAGGDHPLDRRDRRRGDERGDRAVAARGGRRASVAGEAGASADLQVQRG